MIIREERIGGFSRYGFRSDGEVISYWGKNPRPLIGGVDKDGYRKFVLIDNTGNRCHVRRSTMICIAFHGTKKQGYEVRHLDGSRQNDAPANLAWSTHKENCEDKEIHGTIQRGEVNGNHKITNEQAQDAIDRLRNGESAVEIANSFGVARSLIYNIKYGKCWAWLKKDQLL